MNETHIPGVDPSIPPRNAVSVYSQDAMDDFPVLKAFQQYIDAEQAKARKRLLSLGVFFGILTGAIIAVFVVMLMNVTARNQQLNDRLVEYAMKDRDRQSAVVVQPPQDSSAILALTSKIDELQKKLEESRAKAEKDAAAAAERARQEAIEAAKPKGPTPEELEIERLKALLASEREKAAEQARIAEEKAAAERERKRQEELEQYRRKHYPELYGLPKTLPARRKQSKTLDAGKLMLDEDDDDLLPDDDSAIDYFGETKHTEKKRAEKKQVEKKQAPAPAATATPAAEEPPYVIPVEVKGKSSNFRIPI